MFVRATPILPVVDVRQELSFYETLGFRRYIDPAETYPVEQFAAVSYGEHILFGLALADPEVTVPPQGLVWQFEVDDLEAAAHAADIGGLQVVEPISQQSWGRRTMTIRSPSGYEVGLEDT